MRATPPCRAARGTASARPPPALKSEAQSRRSRQGSILDVGAGLGEGARARVDWGSVRTLGPPPRASRTAVGPRAARARSPWEPRRARSPSRSPRELHHPRAVSGMGFGLRARLRVRLQARPIDYFQVQFRAAPQAAVPPPLAVTPAPVLPPPPPLLPLPPPSLLRPPPASQPARVQAPPQPRSALARRSRRPVPPAQRRRSSARPPEPPAAAQSAAAAAAGARPPRPLRC